MKYGLALFIMIPALALAGEAETPEYGLAGVVVKERSATATERALNQQRRSPSAEESELSVPVYVQTQQRLSESFKTPIPESFGEQTRDEN
ncbi:hypothetical protein HML84_13195 [Alcanivorax sp. IO_7]|nr:hypothetical protein HML84_13195 [Alcanivorax sp. IO_7]